MSERPPETIAGVVAELRNALAQVAGGEPAAAGAAHAPPPPVDQTPRLAAASAGLAEMSRVVAIPVDVQVTTRPGGLAPIRRVVKQPIRKAIRWYVSPVATQTRWFAEATLDTATALVGEVGRLGAELERLRADLDARLQALADAHDREVADLHERLVRAERLVRRAEEAARGGANGGPPAATAGPAGATATDVPGMDYVGFEDVMRGSEDDIAARQTQYLECFADVDDILDVGCGRGEFLRLLRDAGKRATGVDRDPDMVDRCRAAGLEVVRSDAQTLLGGLPDDALGGIFAAQVVEHMPPPALMAFLEAARRVLRPGGVLVLETINPASLSALRNYFADLTHARPLVAETLALLVGSVGFRDVSVRLTSELPAHARLQAVPADGLSEAARGALQRNVELLNGLLFAPQDYAVIARG